MSFTSDPMFQLGMALGGAYGNIWANNATKRQGARADRIIEDMQNANAIERIANMGTIPAQNGDAGREYANKLIQQQAAGIGGVDSGINFGGNPNQYMASIADIKTPSGGLEYSLANVDEDKKYLAKLSPYNQKLANWNPDYTEDNVRKELQRAGLAKDVIDEKAGEVKSDIAKRAEAVLLPSIQKKMFYGYDTVEQTKDEQGNVVPINVHHDPDANSYMQAMSELELLKQYSPEAYKTYASQMVGPKDLYNERLYNERYDKQVKTQRENAAQQHKWKVADTMLANQLATERAKVTAAYRQSLVNAGRAGGRAGLKMSDIKTLIELGNSAIASDNPALQRQGQQILAQAYSLLGGDNGGGSAFANRDPDWNNYNDAMTAAHESLNAGNSKEQVAAQLKQHMGDGELYRKVISDLGIAPKSESAKKVTSPSSSGSSFFPNWGGEQEGGLVKWLREGGTVKGYFENN